MPRLCGALDLGTNSTQLLVARHTDGGWELLHEWVAVTRLGEDVQRTGRLKQEAIERTLDRVGGFLAEARERYPGLTGVAAGTSALRDATNRDDFLQACQGRFGFVPAVFSGREEAETTFLGVASGLPADVPLLNLDVGGGSTEVSAGHAGECLFAASLDLGCVRFGERYSLLGVSSPEDRAVARSAARELLLPMLEAARAAMVGHAGECQISASGGTATTLAACVQSMQLYDPARVEGWRTSSAMVGEWAERTGGMTLVQRTALPCLNEGRALVWPAGLLVLHEALECLGIDTIRVTTRGLRAGMLERVARGTLAPCWQL
jgi:exopolyphosphatase/guanosine-5'-triphosphate,3'-diphosphate pyrophosphatase